MRHGQAFPSSLQAVLSDADSAIHLSSTDQSTDVSESDATGFSLRALSSSLRTPSPRRRSSRHRSLSPVFSDSTLMAVRSALHKRQLQLQVRRTPCVWQYSSCKVKTVENFFGGELFPYFPSGTFSVFLVTLGCIGKKIIYLLG